MSAVPSTMRAWQYNKINAGGFSKSLTLNEIAPPAKPASSSGQVRVEVHSTSLNPIDHKLPELPLSWLVMKRPATPGLDFAGVVRLPSGTTVDGFKDGDRVLGGMSPGTAGGALADYVVVPASSLAILPDEVSFDQGASLGVAGCTAYVSVKSVKPGQTVFVNGSSGGVGSLQVQILKILGAKVVASCSGANVQFVTDLGADEVIDYRSTNLLVELKKKGKVFDLIVDNVGGDYALHKASGDFIVPGGSIVQIGGPLNFGGVKQMVTSALLPAWLGGSSTPWSFFGTLPKREDRSQLAAWVGEGKLKTIVDTTFSFDQAPAAFDKLKTGRSRGKVIVTVKP